MDAGLAIWMPDGKLPGASLLHTRQIMLEETMIYAVASAEVAGVVEDAAAGIVGGFAADIGTEDVNFGVCGEATELAMKFGFGHDALVPVGVKHFSGKNVLIDGDVDRESELVEDVWQLARCAAIQDVVRRKAGDAHGRG